MTSKRNGIPLKVQLAAALLQIPDENGRTIPHEHARLLTADQVISLFHRDHYPIRKVDGGPDVHWNITFRFISAHRYKTNINNGTGRGDLTDIAHERDMRKAQAEHSARMAAKGMPVPLVIEGIKADQPITWDDIEDNLNGKPWPKRKMRSRGFSKGRRPLRSRNDLRRQK